MNLPPKTEKYLKALSYLSGLAIIYFLVRDLDLNEVWQSILNADKVYLGIAFLVSFLIIPILTFQFHLFLPVEKRLSAFQTFKVVSVWQMMAQIIPWGGAQALLVYYLGHREKVGKTATVSLLATDQVVEGLSKSFVFLIVLFVPILPEWLRSLMGNAAIVVGTLFFILLGMSWKFKDAEPVPLNGSKWKRQILHSIYKFSHHLFVFRSFPLFLMTLILGIGMKVLEAYFIFWIQQAFSVPVTFLNTFLVLAALTLATSFPVTPGRIGVLEGAAFLIYKFLGCTNSEAVTLGIFIHLGYSLPFFFTGYFSLVSLKKRQVISSSSDVVAI